MKIIYPGSFDPITLGHVNIITRASKLFDEVLVLVADNHEKSGLFTTEERLTLIEKSCAHLKNVSADSTPGLTVDFAKQHKFNMILRSLRNSNDAELELQLAFMNRQLANHIESIFLPADPEFINVSSSLIKEVVKAKGDASKFLPEPVIAAMHSKLQG